LLEVTKSRRRVKGSGKDGMARAGKAWAKKLVRHGCPRGGMGRKRVAQLSSPTRVGRANFLESF